MCFSSSKGSRPPAFNLLNCSERLFSPIERGFRKMIRVSFLSPYCSSSTPICRYILKAGATTQYHVLGRTICKAIVSPMKAKAEYQSFSVEPGKVSKCTGNSNRLFFGLNESVNVEGPT